METIKSIFLDDVEPIGSIHRRPDLVIQEHGILARDKEKDEVILEKQEPKSNLGELDVNLQEVDFKQRAFLKELLVFKKQIRVELEKEDLDVLVQERLEQALSMIQHILNLHRFTGF